jgi:hypothetical protein
MTEDDRPAFGRALAQTMETFGPAAGVVTAGVLDTWWGLFQRFTLSAFAAALRQHLLDPDRGRFPPRPADIIHHLTRTMPEAMLAAAHAYLAPRRDEMLQLTDRIAALTLMNLDGEHAMELGSLRTRVNAIVSDPAYQRAAGIHAAGSSGAFALLVDGDEAPVALLGAALDDIMATLGVDDNAR